MSRSISAELQSAQDSSKRKPSIPVIFTSKDGLTTYDYSYVHGSRTNRVLRIRHAEFPYDDSAIIILQNDDLAVPDLKGYYVEIEYGDNTVAHGGSGNESEATPRLWVEDQQYVSASGVLECHLNLEGMKRRMMRQQVLTLDGITVSDGLTGDINPDWYFMFIGQTYYDILKYIIEVVMGWTLLPLGDQDDGIINTTVPEFEINFAVFEWAGIIVERLMNQTKCYLRFKAGLEVEVRYPQDGDSVDESFYSDQQHNFYEYTEKDSVLSPNYIITYGNKEVEAEDPWANIKVGSASDVGTNEQTVKEIHQAVGLRTQGEIDNLAAAILGRYNSERTSGLLLTPHSAKTELFDRAEIINARGT